MLAFNKGEYKNKTQSKFAKLYTYIYKSKLIENKIEKLITFYHILAVLSKKNWEIIVKIYIYIFIHPECYSNILVIWTELAKLI